MRFKDKYIFLKKTIEDTIIPLINSDYHLIDLPYHSNIGDILIWQGEIELLSKLKYKCISSSSRITYRNISNAKCILFHGGGNFGDLYREHIELLLKVIENNPNSRIVVFPQTIHYNNSELFANDIRKLKLHKDLHICVRDIHSYNLINNHISNTYMLPDMAFCIPMEFFDKYTSVKNKGSLYLKRVDNELLNKETIIDTDYVYDWPTFYNNIFDGTLIAKILDNLCKIKLFNNSKIIKLAWDWWAQNIYKNDLLKIGIKFIKQYDPIYTSRLHGLILGLLCNKSMTILDNSYGKNLNFVRTWLQDVDEVKIYLNNENPHSPQQLRQI